jgi:serine/threonine protein kinase
MAAAHVDPALLALQFPDLSGIAYVTGGGQKSVYRATHANYGLVALKIFSDFADAQRVEREVQAVQQIRCPNVPQIFATGFLAGSPKPYFWLIEAWLDGDNLRTRLAGGALSDDLVLLVARNVSYVLSEAERHHIVHRDVKPENIFVNSSGSKCWLLDFGIARHLERSTLTRAGAGQGPLSPGYAVMQTELPRPARNIDAAGEFSDLVMVMTRSRRGQRPRTAAKAHSWISGIRP